MIDTLTISRELTKAGIPSAHADAIATGIQQASDHGDHVTASELRAEIATVNGRISTEIAALESRLYRFLMVQAAVIIGLTVAILRFLSSAE